MTTTCDNFTSLNLNEISQKELTEARNEKYSIGSFNAESTGLKQSLVKNDIMDSSAAHADQGSTDRIPSPKNSDASSLSSSKGMV